ncbi:hypothetical protein HK405_001785, partial [Cladochytrium tenue]
MDDKAVWEGEVVRVSLAQLQDEAYDLTSAIARAFGRGGLGVLVVDGLGEAGFAAKRARLLAQGSALAALPPEALERATHAASSYSFGWSHGKERVDGRLDFAKGSFYN